jgi:hypothetical protein
MRRMKTGGETTALEKLLRPLPLQFTTDLARALVNLRADSEVQFHYDELSEKHTEGTLTAAEAEELEAMVRANTLLGLLQAEARLVLSHTKAS